MAVWKWENLIYRIPPFVVATIEPFLYGWDNIMEGIIAMNIGTAAFLFALRLEEMLGPKSSPDKK